MSKRRSRRTGGPEDKYSEVLEHVLDLTDTGRRVSELFLQIPSASLYPDYRNVVTAPISLAEISKRARLRTYENDEEFLQDFEQMAINASLYNGEDSPIVDDALMMYDFAREALGRPQSEMSLRREQYMVAQDLSVYKYKGHLLAESFLELPNKSDLPDYYKTIKNPISFKEIFEYLRENPYKDWEEFEKTCGLIFTNAMTYNAEGSQIHSDAKSLARQLHNKVLKQLRSRKPIPQMSFKVLKTESNSDIEDVELEAPIHRFDDEDDDDFEADGNEDDDDEDEKDGVNSYDQPQKQIIVRDEIIKRQAGSTARDAMLQLVTCASILHHSVLHTMHYGARGDKPQIPPAYARDMVQVRVSASKKDVFTSFSTTLPSYHHTLSLTVYLHDRMRMLPHSLTVLLNGRKLQAGGTASGEAATGTREEYEVRLSPGLNQVTIAVIGPDSAGTVRPFGPPPIVGAEPDEERMILWLNLSR